MQNDLIALGFDEERATEFEPYAREGLLPGRVAVQHRGAYDLYTADGELRAEVLGRLLHEGDSASLPAVGDWVAFALLEEGRGVIHAVLERRTKFSRKTAWSAAEEQVLATNVDVVFLVMALNEDFNVRRLERYLTLAWESGASPVVLLTKTDLADDLPVKLAEVGAVTGGVPVHPVSALAGEGLDAVRGHLGPGRTVALLGSSGVGKSTLVNTLAGEQLLETKEIREDGKGRHTTTRRELILLPGGGLVIDTPGMREVQLWVADEGLDEAFEDVAGVAAQCRFSDCSHTVEPGCAVLAALADGTLSAERWESYVKLQRELEYLDARLDKRKQAENRRKWAKLGAEARANMRLKGHR